MAIKCNIEDGKKVWRVYAKEQPVAWKFRTRDEAREFVKKLQNEPREYRPQEEACKHTESTTERETSSTSNSLVESQ